MGTRFTFAELKAYLPETMPTECVIRIDDQIFSEPDVKRGDWFFWLPGSQELVYQRII